MIYRKHFSEYPVFKLSPKVHHLNINLLRRRKSMSKIFGLLSFFLLIACCASASNAQNTKLNLKEVNNLKEVRNVYIDKWASNVRDGDFVESSCKLYQEEQMRSHCQMTREEVRSQRTAFFDGLSYIFQDYGFNLVSDFEKADAVMTMRVSVQKNCGGLIFSDFWKNRAVGFYVETIEANLKTFGGKPLWKATSPGRNSYRDGTNWIAENLRMSRNKPLKSKKAD
jgi:hypothetical protein